MHVNADVPGFEDDNGIKLPYIITIDQFSRMILSIRRNWNEAGQGHFKRLPILYTLSSSQDWAFTALV
jgi:hypothetical protein